MKSAVFFDRDGVLLLPRVERNQTVSPLSLTDLRFNPEAEAPLLELKRAGFILIATSNQPGISQGTLPRRELDRMNDALLRQFPLDDILICPHDAGDQCPCRKPKPGLFQEASFKWHLDLERCFVVSDKWQDAKAAQILGVTSLMLRSPWIGNTHHDFVLDSIDDLAAKIDQLHSSSVLAMDQV